MDFPAQLFPHTVLWSANVGLFFVLVAALRRAPLARLRDNEFSHVYFAACVVLLLLWNTRVDVLPALNFHLLGVTAMTLMFGWHYAALAVSLVTAGTIINQDAEWLGLGLNTLVTGGLPIVLTEALLRVTQRRLPHNFFIYIYINGFFAAGASTLAASLLGAVLLFAMDDSSAGWLTYQLFPYLPLIFFSEAFLNGMIMTGMVVLRPRWVCSFDDELYLNDK